MGWGERTGILDGKTEVDRLKSRNSQLQIFISIHLIILLPKRTPKSYTECDMLDRG